MLTVCFEIDFYGCYVEYKFIELPGTMLMVKNRQRLIPTYYYYDVKGGDRNN